VEAVFSPKIGSEDAGRRHERWTDAVERALDWAEPH
jgi:hypothetical protein